jgi:hypothetical protein
MNHSIRSCLIFFAALALPAGLFAAENTNTPEDLLPVERFALYIASNDGGEKRENLKYASSDARKLAKTMSEIGGVPEDNSLLLTDPTRKDIDRAFMTVKAAIERDKGKAKRTEFLFYYSGHSNEKEFLLGKESYSYDDLKDKLDTVPTDVHVVMLDSCYSGNFVREKGGSRQKPFLMDDSTVVKGHAYLSSSSEREASQESDKIKASYFTQALVTGLRGAADASGDNKVSLNELYHYAFNQTLEQTEQSSVGPQHPSYNITLVGSGDLILTDISESESILFIPAEYEGTYFVRDVNGVLISEINKIRGTRISLALPAGEYSIVVVTAATTKQGVITIDKGERISLNARDFCTIGRTAGRSRGDADDESDARSTDLTPFSLSLFPGLMFPATPENARISLGLFGAKNGYIHGVQANSFIGIVTNGLDGIQGSGFMNIASGNVNGVQGAGFMNIANGDMRGVQGSGFMNIANMSLVGVQGTSFMNICKGALTGGQGAGFMNIANGPATGFQAAGFMNFANQGISGAQIAGFMNVAKNTTDGVQIAGFMNVAEEVTYLQVSGFINVAKSNKGVALGLLNFIEDGVMSPAAFVDSDSNVYVQYQGGTHWLYTTFLAGMNTDHFTKWDYTYTIFGTGIGIRFEPVRFLSFDIETLWKSVVDFSAIHALDADAADAVTVTGSGESTQVTVNTDSASYKEMEAMSKAFNVGQMPSIRGTVNLSFAKHLSLFGSVNLDGRIYGYNDDAFTRGIHGQEWKVVTDRFSLYPSFSVGIKF